MNLEFYSHNFGLDDIKFRGIMNDAGRLLLAGHGGLDSLWQLVGYAETRTRACQRHGQTGNAGDVFLIATPAAASQSAAKRRR